jgi:hypothetical protein
VYNRVPKFSALVVQATQAIRDKLTRSTYCVVLRFRCAAAISGCSLLSGDPPARAVSRALRAHGDTAASRPAFLTR